MDDQTRVTKNADAALIASNKYVATDVMKLFNSSFTPTQNSLLADFTAAEVNFTGYGAATLASPWLSGLSASGNLTLIYPGTAVFAQTGTAATDIAGGWWIEDVGGSNLLLFGTFADPITFDATGDTVIVKPSEILTDLSDADVETIDGP